jgi:hypothetical protein
MPINDIDVKIVQSKNNDIMRLQRVDESVLLYLFKNERYYHSDGNWNETI